MNVYILTRDQEILGVFSSWELAWETVRESIGPVETNGNRITTSNGTEYHIWCESVSDEVIIITE